MGRDHEKAAADDVLRNVYGQYWAEVKALTQTHIIEAPADEEWLAEVRARATAQGFSGKAVRHSSRRAALLRWLRWLLWLVLPMALVGPIIYFLLLPRFLSHSVGSPDLHHGPAPSVGSAASAGMSGSAASVAYLIMAVFLGGLAVGVVAMVAVAVRKEDRQFSLSGAVPGLAARRSRRLARLSETARPDHANWA